MMIQQQLLSLVSLVASLQHGASGFSPAPKAKCVSLLFASDSSPQELSGYTRGKVPYPNHFPTNKEDVQKDESSSSSSSLRENDLSMFLAQKEESQMDNCALDFFMKADESIQRLEEVEDSLCNEPFGFMMEEQPGVVPAVPSNTNTEQTNKIRVHKNVAIPVPSDKIKLAKDTSGIGINEERVSKKVVQYEYDGTLSKIKRNMYNTPANYYTE